MFYDVYERLCTERGEQPYALPVKLGLMKKNSAVCQWKGGSVPRAKTLKALADYFGVSVAYLMDLQDEADIKNPPTPESEGRAVEDWEKEALACLRALPHDVLVRELAYLRERASGQDK